MSSHSHVNLLLAVGLIKKGTHPHITPLPSRTDKTHQLSRMCMRVMMTLYYLRPVGEHARAPGHQRPLMKSITSPPPAPDQNRFLFLSTDQSNPHRRRLKWLHTGLSIHIVRCLSVYCIAILLRCLRCEENVRVRFRISNWQPLERIAFCLSAAGGRVRTARAPHVRRSDKYLQSYMSDRIFGMDADCWTHAIHASEIYVGLRDRRVCAEYANAYGRLLTLRLAVLVVRVCMCVRHGRQAAAAEVSRTSADTHTPTSIRIPTACSLSGLSVMIMHTTLTISSE